jgi:hypothetical protein
MSADRSEWSEGLDGPRKRTGWFGTGAVERCRLCNCPGINQKGRSRRHIPQRSPRGKISYPQSSREIVS